jgi:predicted RNA polymerase sigma factor
MSISSKLARRPNETPMGPIQTRRQTMRVMVFGKASEDSEKGAAPTPRDLLHRTGQGLIFTACHPILSPDARAALTLKVVGGLTTDEIARAFLSSEAAIAQRIVRAKKAIATAGLTFEVLTASTESCF